MTGLLLAGLAAGEIIRTGIIRTETLPNGLTVMVREDRRTPRVAFHLRVAAGAAEDPAGRSGLAHLVEHLLYEGSEHAPGDTYDRVLAEAGGENNAWTDHDSLVFAAVVPAGAAEQVMFLESDRLRGIVPDVAALRNQKDVVARERARERRPGGLAEATLATLLWPPGHPYRARVMGDPDEVEAAVLADVIAFHARAFRPERISLAIAGDFDGDAMLARARAWFADLPARPTPAADPPPPPLPPLPPPPPARSAWMRTDTVVAQVSLAWRTVPMRHADVPALDLVARLLARGEVAPVAWSGSRGGSFRVTLDEAERRSFERALAQLARDGPAAEELRAKKAWMRADWARRAESLERRAELLNLCWARTGAPDCLAAGIAARDAVTAEDVRRVVRTWLAPDARVTLAQVPDGERPPSSGMERVFPP